MGRPGKVTADQFTREWIAERREIVEREGYALRAGPARLTIEVKSLITNEWCVLRLPGDLEDFAEALTRDAVLLELQGVPTMVFPKAEVAS